MSKISEMTRESWIESTFPEWGTWLVEDIENEVSSTRKCSNVVAGCTGVWFKHQLTQTLRSTYGVEMGNVHMVMEK